MTRLGEDQGGAGMITDALRSPNARIQLYPLLVRRNNARDYSLIRLGCRTITVLSTTHSGVLASRLLREGHSAGEVSARLASIFRCEAADIQPLLTALLQARMIRSIDGRTVEAEPPSLKRLAQQRLEWIRIIAVAAVIRAFIWIAPVAATHRTMYFLRPNWSRRRLAKARAEAQRNMISVLGGSVNPQRIRSLAHEFVAEQVRCDVDLQLMSGLPELKTGKWLRRHCMFYGLEHLDTALAKGHGVLASGFHFSSMHIIALLLWLRGYSFTGAGGRPWRNQNGVLPCDNPELTRLLKNCGEVKWHETFTFESALNICRTLNGGGLALVFPDGIANRAKGELAKYFGHDAAPYKRAQCKVPFLGRMASGNMGVPWIYKQTRAPLIPVKVVRDSFHRFQVIVGREIQLDRSAPLEKITAELYDALDREIRLDPAAWNYWRILDQFTTES
jgi:lauroyl/myristoyl acyltransferase